MEFWEVTLQVWTPDEVHKINFSIKRPVGSAFGYEKAQDAIDEAYECAKRNDMRVITVESLAMVEG